MYVYASIENKPCTVCIYMYLSISIYIDILMLPSMIIPSINIIHGVLECGIITVGRLPLVSCGALGREYLLLLLRHPTLCPLSLY